MEQGWQCGWLAGCLADCRPAGRAELKPDGCCSRTPTHNRRAGLPLDWARMVREAALAQEAADTILEGAGWGAGEGGLCANAAEWRRVDSSRV